MSVPPVSATISPTTTARDVEIVCCTNCCPTFRRGPRSIHVVKTKDGGMDVEISPPRDCKSTLDSARIKHATPITDVSTERK